MRDPIAVLVLAAGILIVGVCQIIWRHRIAAYLRGRRVPALGDAGKRVAEAQRSSTPALMGSVLVGIALLVGWMAARALLGG